MSEIAEKEMAETKEAYIRVRHTEDEKGFPVGEREHEKRKTNLLERVHCIKKKAFENDAMIDDKEMFKIEKEDMAMMRKASRG